MIETVAPARRHGAGRPPTVYALSTLADGVFPKRYVELLDTVLERAKSLGLLDEIFSGIAGDLAARLKPRMIGSSPEEVLLSLLDGLDYGDMLASLDACEGGWELHAHNCLYHASGQRFVEVCELLPLVIEKTGVFDAARIACQRDGRRSCDFLISRRCLS